MKKSITTAVFMLTAATSFGMSSAHAAKQSSEQTIVQIAAGNPDFSTLVTALTDAGLVDTLSAAGPFTVFAPTNEAFAKIPAATLQGLLGEKSALTKVLTYHVIAGKESEKDLVCNYTTATVEGDTVTTQENDGQIEINSSHVLGKPIHASNGVIYVIDSVLLPN